MIIIPDLIDDVVASMRETGPFTVLSVTGNTYTLDTPDGNGLNPLTWVNIGGREYKVTASDANSFTVESATPIIDGDYTHLEPYYMYGHRLEISNRLMEKDADEVFKYQKYPLIALRLPTSSDEKFDNVGKLSLNIAIMEFTDRNYIAPERYDNVIKPILAPLYDRFMQALIDSPHFDALGRPEHTRVTRLFWGIEETEGNRKYIFNDPLDAIEIINLQLNVQEQIC